MLQKTYLDDKYKQPSKNIHQNNPQDQPLLKPFIQLYYFLVSAGAVPVRLLFHKNFGERSITPLTWAVSFGFHVWYLFEYAIGYVLITGAFIISYILDIESGSYAELEDFSFLSLLVINGFTWYLLVAFFINGRKVFKNVLFSLNNSPTNNSSYHRGESVYLDKKRFIGKTKFTFLGKLEIDNEKFRILIEPQYYALYGIILIFLFPILGSLVISNFNHFFATWLSYFLFSTSSAGVLIFFSSICLFLEEYGIRERIRNSALDIIDGEKDLKLILETKDKIISSKSNVKKNNLAKQENYPIVRIG